MNDSRTKRRDAHSRPMSAEGPIKDRTTPRANPPIDPQRLEQAKLAMAQVAGN